MQLQRIVAAIRHIFCRAEPPATPAKPREPLATTIELRPNARAIETNAHGHLFPRRTEITRH